MRYVLDEIKDGNESHVAEFKMMYQAITFALFLSDHDKSIRGHRQRVVYQIKDVKANEVVPIVVDIVH